MRVLMVGPGESTGGGMWSCALSIMEETAEWAEVRFIETAVNADATRLRKLRVAAWSYVRVLAYLLTFRPEVVHIHFASGSSIHRKLPVIVVSRVFRAPVVAHLHGGGFEDYIKRSPRPLAALTRRVLRMAALVVSPDERGIRLLDSWLGEGRVRGIVIPNTVPLLADVREAQRTDDSVLFAFVGRLSPEKGLDVLLRAWPVVRLQFPDSRLEVAGAGALNPATAGGFESHGVSFLGHLAASERDALLRRADAFVMPSLVENVPLALLEALAAGLPAIASRVGGIPDVLENGHVGVLVDPGDVAGLADAMVAVAGSRELRAELGARAAERARAYDRSRLSEWVRCVYLAAANRDR